MPLAFSCSPLPSFSFFACFPSSESCLLCLCIEVVSTGRLIGFAAFGDDGPHYWTRIVAENVNADETRRLKERIKGAEPSSQVSTQSGESGVEVTRHETDWADFIRTHFRSDREGDLGASDGENRLTPFNSIWLRYLLLLEDASITSAAIDRVIQSLFSTLTQIDQILVATPSTIEPFPPLTDARKFTELHRRSDEELDAMTHLTLGTRKDLATVRLFQCPRTWFLPNLVVRRARIEDNDDLVPICNAQSEILTEIYGEFFLATLIHNQNAHQHALVAEVNGRAVGLTGVTDQVDVALLQDCFDLEAYEQLRKAKSPEQEAEENSGPTPLSRMHNIFRTIASNTAPLSQAEKDRLIQSSVLSSKRSTLVASSKRNTATGLANLAGLLKSEAASAVSTTAPPVSVTGAGTGAGSTTPSSALNSPQVSTHTLAPLTLPSGAIGQQPELSPTAAAAAASNGMLNASSSTSQLGFPQPSDTMVDEFPIQWLYNYVETFRPDPNEALRAATRRDQRERRAIDSDYEHGDGDDGGDTEPSDEEYETDEALLLSIPTVLAKLAPHLASPPVTQQAFTDLLVAVVDELDADQLSIGGFLRFLELAVRVPPDMPVRPPPIDLPPTMDDGTAKDNVFCITLFCLDAQYESRSLDILRAVFDLYPDRNYCVLTLPHTSPPSSIQMLSYFTYVKPTLRNTFSHAMYLLHRDTIATLNALDVTAAPLVPPTIGKSGLISSASLVTAEDASYAALEAELMPLIGHLANLSTIRTYLRSAVQLSLQVYRETSEGTRNMRLRAKTTAGLSGRELLERRKEIRMQLLESKTTPTELLLVTCHGAIVGVVLFNRLADDEVTLLRRDFALDDFISYDDLPKVDVPKAHVPPTDPHDPQAPPREYLEDLRTSVHINILTMVINPLWNGQIGFICKELLRMKKAHVLYYQVWSRRCEGRPDALRHLSQASGLNQSYKFASESTPPTPTPTHATAGSDANGTSTTTGGTCGVIVPQLIDNFVQVRPRRRPAIAPLPESTSLIRDGRDTRGDGDKNDHAATATAAADGDDATRKLDPSIHLQSTVALPCALHVLTRRLISQPKTVINSRLVIVGSSTTALSFLETLLLIPDKHYSSITLLSKAGLTTGSTGNGDTSAGHAHLLPWSLEFSESRLDRLALTSRITILRGTMIDLRSKEKTIVLADGSILPYDVLVLTTGLQNQFPLRLIRTVAAQALADELRAKEASRIAREEAARDARRKKKAQEQGLEDASGLDAEGLARLDEELEREAQRAKERLEEEAAGENASGDDEDGDADDNGGDEKDDADSVVSFDSTGKRRTVTGRTKKKRHGGGGGAAHSSSVARASTKWSKSWEAWQSWSASGLERWEEEFGAILAKQRLLHDGKLDPQAALLRNEAIRDKWRGGGGATPEDLFAPIVDIPFDPSELDLTPYGVSGLYSLSSEADVSFLVSSFRRDLASSQRGPWLVHGLSLEALTGIHGLIELGVRAEKITWVHDGAQVDAAARRRITSRLLIQRTAGYNPSASQPQEELPEDELFVEHILQAITALGVRVQSGKTIQAVKQEKGKVYAVLLGDASTSSPTNKSGSGSGSGASLPSVAQLDAYVEIPAIGVIGCGDLDCDPYIFRSITGNSLVYDGRLVLNHAFQTTVPSIYAGGPLGKFSRAYGASCLQLESYNSYEVGQKLCHAVLKHGLETNAPNGGDSLTTDSTTATNSTTTTTAKRTQPNATIAAANLPPLGIQPQVTHALLPGNLIYFHAAIPTHKKIRQPKVLTTNANGRLVRLVFNDYNLLHSLTILSSPYPSFDHASTDFHQQSFDRADFLAQTSAIHDNLVRLIGVPASYMNKILFRYQQEQIADLVQSVEQEREREKLARGYLLRSDQFSLSIIFTHHFPSFVSFGVFRFLSGSWSFALYHESFSQLRAYLHYFMLENRLEMVAIIDRIITFFTTSDNSASRPSSASSDGEVRARNVVDESAATPIDPFLVTQLASLLPIGIKEVVQRALLRFLREHEQHLPIYKIEKPIYTGPQAKMREQL